MVGWNFIPWNMQYLAGGLVALATTIFVFRRDTKTSSNRCFLAYGACVVVYMFSVLFARSAPSLTSSGSFYRIMHFSFPLTQALLFLTILQIRSPKGIYYLTLVPSVFVSLFTATASLPDPRWTDSGWAYSLTGRLQAIGLPVIVGYPVAMTVVLIHAIRRSRLTYLKRKYSLILVGFLAYFIPVMITNAVMWRDPNVRAFGGFLLTIEFLFIAYAVYLRPEKIEFAGGRLADTLSDSLFRFVRRLREVMPGRELGSDAALFEDVLQSTGLRDTVHDGNIRQVFNGNLSPRLDMSETIHRITDLMKKEEWALGASAEYTELFVELYRRMDRDSPAVAKAWFDTMLRSHGGFLDKLGVLSATPLQAELPPIFKELQAGGAYLLREERPVQAYKKLNQAVEYSFEGLGLSKLEPRKVRETFGVEKATLFWLTFQQLPTEETINPKDLERLNHVTSLATGSSSRAVILLDCLDHIVFANPFEPVRGLLKTMRNLCKGKGATLLVSLNPELFMGEQMEAIEQDLRGG